MNVSNRMDPELVKRAREGDGAAFTELFEALYRPILNYVYHTVGDQPTAEDITQEAFIRAHRSLGKLGPPWDFKSWVYRIAGNLAIDHLRRSKRFVDFEEQVIMGEPSTTRRPAERNLQREDAVQSVHGTLGQMPTGYRQALILRELNGLSYQQMAAAMDCSYANARQIVHRARMRFRDLHLARMTLVESAARCPVLGEMLSAYHDGELSPAQQREVEEHIAGCRDCQQTRDEFRKVGALVAGLMPVLPTPGFESAVLEKLQLKPAVKPPPGAGAAKGAGKGSSLTRRAPGGEAAAPPGKGGGGWLAALQQSIAAQIAIGVFAGGVLLTGFVYGLNVFLPPDAPLPPPPVSTVASPPADTPTAAAAVIPAGEDTAEPGEPVDDPTPTPTTQPPMAEAVMDANCRFGPGDVYAAVGSFLTGEFAPVHGRNYTSTWWWINFPENGEHCWVWDGSVELSGDTTGVPVIAAPPTPVPPDVTPPVVTITYRPMGTTRPSSTEVITFTSTASDDIGVERIEIWVQSAAMNAYQLAGSCTGSDVCTILGGPYPGGTLLYYAAAFDAAGNEGQSAPAALTVYSIVN